MVGNLVSGILDGVLGGENWDKALDEICRETGAKGGVIQADDEDHTESHLYGVSRFYREEGAFIIERNQRGEDKGDEEGYRVLSTLPPNEMSLERSIFGVKSNAEMPESEHRAVLESVGHGTRSIAVLNPSGPWFDLVTLTSGSESSGERTASHSSIPLILNLVSKTIELQRILSSLRRRYSAALTALDHLGLGVVLTNQDADILLTNNEAQRILDLKDGLKANAKRQLVGEDNNDARLRGAILASVSPAEFADASASPPITIGRPSGAYDFLVSISPLRDSGAELERGLQVAFVLIVDPARSGALDAGGLTLLGKLTNAESEVANHLVSGKSAQEIADMRDTSPLTVRGQVKTIGAKLRCRSQADIIRLAAVTRLPIGND